MWLKNCVIFYLDTTGSNVKRCASDSTRLTLPTTRVLSTAAESLRNFVLFSDKYTSTKRPTDFLSAKAPMAPVNENTFQYLITLDIKNFRKDTSVTSQDRNGSRKPSEFPYTDVKANFNNLDIVFNAKSWVTILNFLHKLKPSRSSAKDPVGDDRSFASSQEDKNVLQAKPGQLNINVDQRALEENTKRTFVNIDFKKLNVLLMRHIVKFDTLIGRKLSTVTMQGARVVADISHTDDADQVKDKPKLDVSGSIASLQMQDLTSSLAPSVTHGYEILRVGTQSLESTEPPHSLINDPLMQDDIHAFSFRFRQTAKEVKTDKCVTASTKGASRSYSIPAISMLTSTDVGEHGTEPVASDTMLFKMDAEDCGRQGKCITGEIVI